VRDTAMKAILEIKEHACASLIQLLIDSKPEVRRAAATVFKRMLDKRALIPLIQALNDPEPSVRLLVLEAIGNLRSNQAAEALINAALGDTEKQVREQAVKEVLNLGVSAIEPLAIVFRGKEPAKRTLAAEILIKMGCISLGPLIDALHDQQPEIRRIAAEALGEIGDPRALPALEDIVRRSKVVLMKNLEEGLATNSAIVAIRKIKKHNAN
jgi:HEAT repeat protein